MTVSSYNLFVSYRGVTSCRRVTISTFCRWQSPFDCALVSDEPQHSVRVAGFWTKISLRNELILRVSASAVPSQAFGRSRAKLSQEH